MSTRIDLDFRPKSYFAGRKVEKVEIARITVNSVCLDSATLRAWPRQRGIQYQVSDGYDGQLLDGEDHTETDRPMSLGELADFLLSTWPLMKFLEMNYKDDLERALKWLRCHITPQRSAGPRVRGVGCHGAAQQQAA